MVRKSLEYFADRPVDDDVVLEVIIVYRPPKAFDFGASKAQQKPLTRTQLDTVLDDVKELQLVPPSRHKMSLLKTGEVRFYWETTVGSPVHRLLHAKLDRTSPDVVWRSDRGLLSSLDISYVRFFTLDSVSELSHSENGGSYQPRGRRHRTSYDETETPLRNRIASSRSSTPPRREYNGRHHRSEHILTHRDHTPYDLRFHDSLLVSRIQPNFHRDDEEIPSQKAVPGSDPSISALVTSSSPPSPGSESLLSRITDPVSENDKDSTPADSQTGHNLLPRLSTGVLGVEEHDMGSDPGLQHQEERDKERESSLIRTLYTYEDSLASRDTDFDTSRQDDGIWRDVEHEDVRKETTEERQGVLEHVTFAETSTRKRKERDEDSCNFAVEIGEDKPRQSQAWSSSYSEVFKRARLEGDDSNSIDAEKEVLIRTLHQELLKAQEAKLDIEKTLVESKASLDKAQKAVRDLEKAVEALKDEGRVTMKKVEALEEEKRAALRMNEVLDEERRKRQAAEALLRDVQRECREPFLVPALFEAFLLVSELSNGKGEADGSEIWRSILNSLGRNVESNTSSTSILGED